MTIDAEAERHYLRIACNEAAGALVFWLMSVVLPLLGFTVAWTDVCQIPGWMFNLMERRRSYRSRIMASRSAYA